ncbi:hypothetical protein [Caudoviricetes sp.]|nr:hypothetical protein [Caudoviricetes sp.]
MLAGLSLGMGIKPIPINQSVSKRQAAINVLSPLSGLMWVVGTGYEWLYTQPPPLGPITTSGVGVQYWVDTVASANAYQTTTAARPTSSAALTPKSINCDGTNDRFSNVPTRLNSTEWTLIVAAKSGAVGSARTAAGIVGGGSYASIGHDSGQSWCAKIGDQTITAGLLSAGTLSIVEARRDGSACEMWLDGVSVGTATTAAGSATLAPMIGALSNSGSAAEFWSGQVAFVAMVNSALSTADRRTIAQYAAEHCGLSYA